MSEKDDGFSPSQPRPTPESADTDAEPSGMVERVAEAILRANAPLPNRQGSRSVGYYMDMGIDHFRHPHEIMAPALARAAARAAIKAIAGYMDEVGRTRGAL